MRLKKIHPTLDSTSTASSPSSSTVPIPPNTLRKPKPPPADTLPPKEDPSASPPRQPATLKKAYPSTRAMNASSSSRSSTSSSSSSSTTTTTDAEVVSLNDDPDLKPIAPPSSSPTKLSQFTFRGWPVSRKPPSTFSPPPSRDGPKSSATHVNYWSSVAPTNPQSQALTPSSSTASASSSSATSTSPSSPWSSADMNRDTSTTSSVYSVKVTAPTAPAIHHPFIPKRPYSAPVTAPPPTPLSDSLPSSPLLPADQQRRRATANGILYQTIPEGVAVTKEVSATTLPPEHSIPPPGFSSPAPSSTSSPLPSRTSPSSDQGYAADNDGDSVGSDRSVIQAVTVVNEPDKYSLHIKLPGFNLNNLCIASRRDRSLLITADKFEDEVPRSSFRSSSSTGSQPSSSTPSEDQEDPQRPTTPPERLAGHFERSVQFGPDADPSRASARFDGETLVINVPKKKTWADVDLIHRSREGSLVDATTPVLPQVEKSPRSIALALGASTTNPRKDKHLHQDVGGSGSGSGGSGSSAAVSPGAESTAESTTSTTPEGEMTSGSSCTDTSSVPSPMSEDGGSPLDEVSRRLDDMQFDLHDGSDEENESENRRTTQERLSLRHSYHHQYTPEPPTPTTFYPQHPSPFVPSYPFSPSKQNSSSPSPIASWLSTTSNSLPRSRSHSPPQPHQHRHSSSGSDSDSSEGRAAARRHFGIEDDLVTPTPQRVQKRRGPSRADQPTATAANHHAVSPKKDYFGFPLTPVLAATSSESEKTTPKSATPVSSSFSNSQFVLKQRSPTREAGPPGVSPSVSPSRMPLSLRRGSISGSAEEDVVEHMRITLPPPSATSSNSASSFAGRTREQGMGRSAFFWKRWAPGQGS